MTPSKGCSAEECLKRIKPPVQPRRFLMSWDADKKELWFGLGADENAVLAGSGGELVRPDISQNLPSSRLSKETVEEFRSRSRTVDGLQMMSECREFLRSYVYFKDERLYDLVSAWAIGTYLYAMFSHFGYLFVHSDSKRCGKTRMEEGLSHLCFEATSPLNGPTVPTIREYAAEGRTLVLDTLERWKQKNIETYCATMEFLDAGFRNGSKVAKMVPADNGGNWKKKEFPVYAPYVLAGIGRKSLADTALDRSLVIEMHRKPIGIKKKKYHHFQCEKECEPLRSKLYLWALQNARALAEVYESKQLEAELDTLELNDRAADIWKPLLAIAKIVGSPELWQALASIAIEMGRDPEAAERERTRATARSLRKLVNGDKKAVGLTSEFLTHLANDGLQVQANELHALLTEWGFSQRSARLDQGPRRAWELDDSRLAEIEAENRSIPPS